MRLLITGEEYYFEKDNETVGKIMGKISEVISEGKLILSHFLLDGKGVYEADYETYIARNIQEIETIEAVFLTPSGLLHDILRSAADYIERAVPELQLLSEECYQNTVADIWVKLGDFLEGIQWFQEIDNFIQKNNLEVEKGLFSFENELVVLSEAIEQQDIILLGDIIRYEILVRFEHIKEFTLEIIQSEVVKSGIN